MRNLLEKIDHLPVSLRIGITPTGIALLECKGWWNTRTRVLTECVLPDEATDRPETIIAGLRKLLTDTESKNRPTTIVVGNAWARLFMVTPPRNTGSLQDCRAAAAMRFQQLYGEDCSNWELTADWQANRPFLACALPAALLGMFSALAKESRLTLLSVAPHFIAAWNQWHRRLDGLGWFGVAQDDHLTVAAIHEKTLQAVHAIQVPIGAWHDPQWFSDYMNRQALRLNLPAPEKLQICGHIPGWPSGKAHVSPMCFRLDATFPEMQRQVATAAVRLAFAGVEP